VTADAVRRFAEDPAAYGEIRPETGLTRFMTDAYCVLLGPVPSFTLVSRLRLDDERIAETIAEVRQVVAEHGHRSAMWWVGSSSTPSDLTDRLHAHGFVPDERPGSEPHATSLVLTSEPPAVDGVEARRVESYEEYRLASDIGHTAFGSSDEDRAEWAAVAEARYEAYRAGHTPRSYLAWVDGRAVGCAAAVIEPDLPAVLMIGGGVLPDARGAGVYRALVRARWDDAVANGTPALCVQAGRMSRPILERLGFEAVDEQEVLLDPATC
jgi:GNAT superfamily N-acetyltransferase